MKANRDHDIFSGMDMMRLGRQAVPTAIFQAAVRWKAVRRAGHDLSLRQAAAPWVSSGHLADLPPGLLSRPVIAVDVGAHIGEWTAALLRLPQTKRVVCVEPTPSSVAKLEMRFSAEPRVSIAPVAVGDEPGFLPLQLATHANFNSLLPLVSNIQTMYEAVQVSGSVTVPVTTLDDLLQDTPEITLLKLDVQGFEPKVLAGGARTLARTTCVIIECQFRSHYDGDALIWDLNPLLEAAGFRLFRLCNLVTAADGGLLWGDGIYVKTK